MISTNEETMSLDQDYNDKEVITFDTLQFARRAELAGFTKLQAEFQAEEMAKLINNKLATKRDIEELKKYMQNIENKMVIKFGAMLTTGIFILAAFLKLT